MWQNSGRVTQKGGDHLARRPWEMAGSSAVVIFSTAVPPFFFYEDCYGMKKSCCNPGSAAFSSIAVRRTTLGHTIKGSPPLSLWMPGRCSEALGGQKPSFLVFGWKLGVTVSGLPEAFWELRRLRTASAIIRRPPKTSRMPKPRSDHFLQSGRFRRPSEGTRDYTWSSQLPECLWKAENSHLQFLPQNQNVLGLLEDWEHHLIPSLQWCYALALVQCCRKCAIKLICAG